MSTWFEETRPRNMKKTTRKDQHRLYAAIVNQQNDLVHLLLKEDPELNSFHSKQWYSYADIRDFGDARSSPLHWAAKYNNCVAIKILMEEGAQVDCLNNADCPSLYNAVEHGHTEAARMLINDFGADPHFTHKDGTNLLHIAVSWCKNPDMIDVLVSAGVDMYALDGAEKPPICYVHPGGLRANAMRMFELGLLNTHKCGQCASIIKPIAIEYARTRMQPVLELCYIDQPGAAKYFADFVAQFAMGVRVLDSK